MTHIVIPQKIVTGLTSLLLAGTARDGERPNILFLFADDWGEYGSCYRDAAYRNGMTAAGYNLTGAQTNGMADTDNDGLINLLEYAFGGNPVGNDAAAVRPARTVVTAGGSNAFVYVYKRRTDDPQLSYSVKLNTTLVNGVWNNVGRLYETATGVTADPNVESVTNRIPAGEKEKIIGLDVSQY